MGRKMGMNHALAQCRGPVMNLLAGLLGYSAFVLTTLAIGGLGYITPMTWSAGRNENWRMSDARPKPPACSLFPLPAFKHKRTFESGLFFKDSKPITAISSSMIDRANCRR